MSAALTDFVAEVDVPPNRVPATFLVAAVDGTLVGRVSIRHELDDFLANFGGHIGLRRSPASAQRERRGRRSRGGYRRSWQ